MPIRRKKLALATPREITMAIYSLTTRGKHARSHIEQELRQIIAAAKSQLADYQKGLENHRRHKKRNPNWPSSIRAAAWFATHRREVIDEPKNVATTRAEAPEQQEEHEWKSLEEYEAWVHQPVPVASVQRPAAPPAPVKTAAQIAYEANLRVSREIGKEKNEAGWDD